MLWNSKNAPNLWQKNPYFSWLNSIHVAILAMLRINDVRLTHRWIGLLLIFIDCIRRRFDCFHSLFNNFGHAIALNIHIRLGILFNCLFFARYLSLSFARSPEIPKKKTDLLVSEKEELQIERKKNVHIHIARILKKCNLYNQITRSTKMCGKVIDYSKMWCDVLNSMILSIYLFFSVWSSVCSFQEQATSRIHHFIITIRTR